MRTTKELRADTSHQQTRSSTQSNKSVNLREKVYQRNFETTPIAIEKYKGTLGNSIALRTNCYRLALQKRQIYWYEVLIRIRRASGDLVPPKNKILKRDIFWDFFLTHGAEFFEIRPSQISFDDERAMFTTKRLKPWQPNTPSHDYEHFYDGTRGRHHVCLTIAEKEIVEFSDESMLFSKIQLYIVNTVFTQFRRIPEQLPEIRSWYGMGSQIIRMHLDGSYQPLAIDHVSKLFEGISLTTKNGPRGPFVNIGLIHQVLATMEMPAIQYYALLAGGRLMTKHELEEADLSQSSMNANQITEFNDHFRDLELKTTYKPIRHYTFERLFEGNARSTFFKWDDHHVSVQDYYLGKYRKTLRFPYLPLVQMRSSGSRVKIPMELCQISLKPQRVRRRLSDAQIAQICRYATFDPDTYFGKVASIANKAILGETAVIEEFGVGVEGDRLDPMRVVGHVLPRPACRYEEKNPLGEPVWEGAPDAYLIPCAANLRRFAEQDQFIRELYDVAHRMGLRFSNEQPPHCIDREFGSADDVRRFMEQQIETLQSTQKTPLFVFIIGDNGNNLYSWIKLCGDSLLGVPTQCINGEELAEKSRGPRPQWGQMTRNLVAKINTRLGGVMNEIVSQPHNECNTIFERYTSADEWSPTMFLGVFSTKPASDEKRPTVISLSFNVNAQATKFSGIYGFAEKGSDFFDEIKHLFARSLMLFKKNVGCFPKQVFIFRTGLTENVSDLVAEFEVGKFVEDCASDALNPYVAYISVERRHKIRFKKDHPGTSHSRGQANMDKGTVVDDTITNGKEFYLCSQQAPRHCTARPALYRIQHADWDISANDIQALTFSLCYLVQRSAATVSTPAPLYYSCLVARRVLDYLRSESNENLGTHANFESATYFT